MVLNRSWISWLTHKRLIIAACGTSWHSGLVGEYLFQYLAKVPVEVEYAWSPVQRTFGR
ncbi:MAG: hypothetical protein U5K71_13260 [Gracilimonas sp.]|nr:hypothetical protein [Gracilimonas sp.]